ncbi:Transposase (or an inactivated derivative) [Salegentibacter salegens]|jgi:transposase-like protein|uniref:Mutator family transposase n=23 Tax=Salegentibacter salegens TaxID=143223 RepID=A0A1M7LP52_9FLAO|nr:IS256 family transposase [Salegentibacter salegens]SHM24963.1 Transposase (or an inactivated derivative) [Salegentibacter salegens]SHM29221.1 Transposase (or an inactivated derivative) [Salegentibacter salegens]SHM29644.1 Transposase (or an inactivated derivative) [Salegentibacter salegens]SHM30629.1 Transposase (or an inactivated derivative) [Salegentibacter salegens]SHM35061.1 Transposase (or an inactivated derivative) [Salegentibacter salegens]
MTQEEIKELKEKALKQFLSGESLTGKNGAFAPMLREFMEEALEAEMSSHLSDEEKGSKAGNKRNGKGKKTLKSSQGDVTINTPQDRNSTFEPEIVAKRQRILADNLEKQIIGMYGMGNSLRDISAHIEEMYDSKISTHVLSDITDRVIPKVKEWQDRPLEPVYCILWLDAMHFKVREEGKVKHKALYNILGINKAGRKEVLGMYISESEGANFWLQVLTQLNNRGLKDILIACTDNLTGFSEAIHSVYPKTDIQLCIVHQIRNSMKYVASKDQKDFMKDLKLVYKADTKDQAESALLDLEEKWGKRYPIVIRSWNDNWDRLSAYFEYTAPIRKLIYTTNAVEAFHRQVRKVTKTKGAFTNDMALLKLVYLATRRIEKKWNAPLQNWGLVVQQLAIKFEGRLELDLATNETKN